MIKNWYNQIPHPALKTKREITKYINWRQFTKGTRGKPNEQRFPKSSNRWSFSYLKFTKYVTNMIAEPKYKYGQQEQVIVRNHNACWSGSSFIYKHAGPVLLVSIRLLIRIWCCIIACWPVSSGIKSPAVHDPVIYINMLARFFW